MSLPHWLGASWEIGLTTGILVILFLVWVTSVTGSTASRAFLSPVTSRILYFVPRLGSTLAF